MEDTGLQNSSVSGEMENYVITLEAGTKAISAK